MQAAINSLPNPGPCTVTVRAGTSSKASPSAASTALRPPRRSGSSPGRSSRGGRHRHRESVARLDAFDLSDSTFLAIEGFDITGAARASINLAATADANSDITIDSDHIHDNAVAGTNSGGIGIGDLNPRTWIVNNLINNNGRNAIELANTGSTSSGSPKYVVNNTIYANGRNGLDTPAAEDVFFVDNLVVGNGTAVGTTGGRWGITSTSAALSSRSFSTTSSTRTAIPAGEGTSMPRSSTSPTPATTPRSGRRFRRAPSRAARSPIA